MKKRILFVALFACAFIVSEAQQPNVLVVIVDDLGFHDLSRYGSKIYETPNVDRLAMESYSFLNAYANYPRCLPSRFAMITGRYPVAEFNGDLTSTSQGNNFIKEFRKSGYQSYYVGKWHQKGDQNSPVNFGFDVSYAANTAGGVASHFYPFNTKKITAPLGEVAAIADVASNGKGGDYLADVLTDKMIGFVRDRDSSRPFFAVLSTYAVHSPFEAKQEDITRNEKQIKAHDYGDTPESVKEGSGSRKMRQDNAVYAAMVENMDWNVGRLLDALKQAGLEKNTIVVFTSDHGGLSNNGLSGMAVATTNSPLRAGKGHLYEGGIRVPLLIRWPGKIEAREDRENVVMLMDLMPTLLDLTTAGQLSDIDGKTFAKVIDGKEKWDERSIFFYEKMARPQTTGDAPCVAMRSGQYKMLHYLDSDNYELYDLSADNGEKVNLIDRLPQVATRLKADLEDWTKKHQY